MPGHGDASTSAAASRRSPAASPMSPPAVTPSAPSASPCSRAWSIRRRAPQGKQTFYAYCHVPAGSTVDMSERIEAQVERFAPGFRRPGAGANQHLRPPRPSATTPTTSAGTSTPARRRCARRSFGRPSACAPTGPRFEASTCALPRRPPAAGCTACAARARRVQPYAICDLTAIDLRHMDASALGSKEQPANVQP